MNVHAMPGATHAWVAVKRDGTTVQRFSPDGTERVPPPDCAEFHLLPHPDLMRERGYRPVSVFLAEGEELWYRKRGHADQTIDWTGQTIASEFGVDIVYAIGLRLPGPSPLFDRETAYIFVLPDGRIEVAGSNEHRTRYERHLDELPLRWFERWGETEVDRASEALARAFHHPGGHCPRTGLPWAVRGDIDRFVAQSRAHGLDPKDALLAFVEGTRE